MLCDKKFLTGDNECYCDFYFLELIKQMSFCYPGIYATYPTLKPYVERVEALPGLAEYIADPNHREAHYFIGAPGVCKITNERNKYTDYENPDINSVGALA
jgi:hypothetical protein